MTPANSVTPDKGDGTHQIAHPGQADDRLAAILTAWPDLSDLLFVPLKLLLYWAAIVVVLHVSAKHAGGQEPPRLRVAAWAAGARFLMGLLFAIPLGLISIQLDAVAIFGIFFVARIGGPRTRHARHEAGRIDDRRLWLPRQ